MCMMHYCIQVDSISISWTGWRRIRQPRALVGLLLYQQSSSTISPCSYVHYPLPHKGCLLSFTLLVIS